MRQTRWLAVAVLAGACLAGPVHASDEKEEKAAGTATAGAVKAPRFDNHSILADKDVGYGDEGSFLTWHGYLNFEYVRKDGIPSTFDNHEFYLSTKARLSEKVSVTAEFEYEHSPGTLILPIQAYADLTANRYLTVRTGIFFSPIGLPRTNTLRGNRNRMVRQVGVTHDIGFENWSEVGIEIFGQTKSGFFYDFAVGNGMMNTIGTGDSWNTVQRKDINGNKAVHSRVGYQTKNVAGGVAVFGLSYGTQKYDPAGLKSVIHQAFDIRYQHRSGWRTQSEFMRRKGDDNVAELAKGVSASAQGWYVQVSKRSYFRNEQSFVEPVVQVDALDMNRRVRDNKELLTTGVGVIVSPVRNYLVKFEYDFVKERYGLPLKNNALWAAIVVEF